MTDKPEEFDIMYYQLILSMQASTMQHLGKVMSPVTGKIERNLDAARYSIDMLDMLQRKTVGNLSSDEQQLLDHVLHQLRLNYLDEVNKGTGAEPSSAESKSPDASSEPGSDHADDSSAPEEGSSKV